MDSFFGQILSNDQVSRKGEHCLASETVCLSGPPVNEEKLGSLPGTQLLPLTREVLREGIVAPLPSSTPLMLGSSGSDLEPSSAIQS